MNPLLELNPGSCVIVVGPGLARTCLSGGDGGPDGGERGPCLSYMSLMRAGVSLLGEEQRGRLQEGLENGSPDAALELESSLASKSLREKWLRESLTLPPSMHPHLSPTLELLLKLQEKGSRLVYTGYDTILDTVAGSRPVLLVAPSHPQSNSLSRWIKGSSNGFLHIHGCISCSTDTQLQNIVLHHSQYQTVIKDSPFFLSLRELFRQRSLLFIGHETDSFNPLLSQMIKNFLQEDEVVKNPPIFMSSLPRSKVPNCFLHLPISKHEECHCLHDLINESKEGSSFLTGRSNEKGVERENTRSQAILVFSEKQSFRKLGDIIYQLNQSGEIYVRRDALTILFGNRIMYGNILTYGGNGLHQIWDLVLPKDSVLQSKGLVALALQNTFMVWLNRKPTGLGSITDVNTFHSLWNNSLTAINQSGVAPVTLPSTPVSSSFIAFPSSSPPVLSPPSALLPLTGPRPPPSFLPLLPFNLLQFRQPLLPLPVLPIAAMATGGVPLTSASGPVLTTPTTGSSGSLLGQVPAPVGMGMSPGTNTGTTTGMGMSPGTGLRMSLGTGMGMGLRAAGMGMSPAATVTRQVNSSRRSEDDEHRNNRAETNTEDNNILVVDNDEREGEGGGGERRNQRLSESSSSSSVNSMDHSGLSRASYCSVMLKAESPLSIEEAVDKILSSHEMAITQLDTKGGNTLTPSTHKNPLQLLPSPITILPQSFPFGQRLSSPFRPLIAYPPLIASSPYMSLLIANQQPPALGGIATTGNNNNNTLPLVRSLISTPSTGGYLPLGTNTLAVGQQGKQTVLGQHLMQSRLGQQQAILAQQAILSQQPILGHQGRGQQAIDRPQTVSSDDSGTTRRRQSIPPPTVGDEVNNNSFQERVTSQPLPPPPSLQSLARTEQARMREPPALLRIDPPEPEQVSNQAKRRRRETMEESETESIKGEDMEGTEATSSSSQQKRESMTSLPDNLREVPFVTSSSSSSSFSSRTFDHLWKFLLHLLLSPNHGHVIQWTGQGYEFCITDHSTLARMWAEASRSDSAPLTYHGLIGELRSYSGLGILESISEDELKYQFKLDIQAYLSMYMDSISQQQ